MEILPSKFRSPPPKPPRRRHSEQLAISSSGTCRKKHLDENKVNMKDLLSPSSDTLSGSLPPNWVADFTNVDNPVFENSNKTFQSMENADFDTSNDSCIEEDATYCKYDTDVKRTKSENSGLEQMRCSLFSTKHFEAFICKNTKDPGINQSYNEPVSTVLKENHRRHHSDPVLRHENLILKDNINKELGICSLVGTSFCDTSKRISDSSITSCSYKETQHLNEEVKTLKEINSKLWQHLCLSQSSIEELRRTSENSSDLSLSDLLSSLYYLQRAKDAAMEERMKIIVDERDTAVQDLEDMIQIIAKSFEDDAVHDEKYSEAIKFLLKEIEDTCNPTKLIHQQRLLLTHLYHSKELRHDKLLHQLKLTTSDRDNLLGKVKILEEEIKYLKLSNDVWNTDNKHWEKNLLNVISQVIQQRDVAVSQLNVMKNVETLNCKRSAVEENAISVEKLAKECEYIQRFDDKFEAVKRKFVTSHMDAKKYDLFSKDSTPDELTLLRGEIAVLSRALEMEVEKRELAEDKCLRLERLVTVLQKKVDGQNVGIHV